MIRIFCLATILVSCSPKTGKSSIKEDKTPIKTDKITSFQVVVKDSNGQQVFTEKYDLNIEGRVLLEYKVTDNKLNVVTGSVQKLIYQELGRKKPGSGGPSAGNRPDCTENDPECDIEFEREL